MTQPTDPTIAPVTASDAAAMSADPVTGNIAALRSLFPDAFAEGHIDFKVLRQLLGDAVDDGDERYGLNWNGKRASRRLALTPSLGTLLPAQGDSLEWNTTRNLMIEGDNLEVLKLLGKSYAGKIKLIYIDPPYNTGNDFVYPDDFKDSIGNYLRRTGQIDHDGIKNTTNAESSGRFHTDWLNMLYPRLIKARELLTRDGMIAIQIDDSEVAHLKMIMDDIFGPEGFSTILTVKMSHLSGMKMAHVQKKFPKIKEHIVLFMLNSENFTLNPPMVACAWDDAFDRYTQWVDDPSLPPASWSIKRLSDVLESRKPVDRETFLIQHASNIFRTAVNDSFSGSPRDGVVRASVSPSGLSKFVLNGEEVIFASKKVSKIDGRMRPTAPVGDIWLDIGINNLHNEGGVPFANGKKPIKLIQRLIESSAHGKDSIVLDFFAGSGTTGHAVMAQNAADGGNRRYILVQLPEPLDPANKDQKAAADFCDSLKKPRTIAELTKERLRRAAAKVKADHPGTKVDLGFRVYKLASSNIRAWNPGTDLAADLLNAKDNLLPGRSEADLLVELLLKNGIDLTEPAVTRTLVGKTVNAFGNGALIVCLADIAENEAEALGDALADWLAELAPVTQSKFWFKDKGFGSNQAKLNLAAILDQRLGTKNIELRSL